MPRYQYTLSTEQFINPYNFVPVNLNSTPRSDITVQREADCTGYFDCHIYCRTPLVIPDTARKREDAVVKGHYHYPFFTIDGKTPVIPGSSLRGVIRSAYETLTDSCFGTMQKDMTITNRSTTAFIPGLVLKEGDRWRLYRAQRHLVVVDSRFYHDPRHQSDMRNGNVTLYSESDFPSSKMGDQVYYRLSGGAYSKNGREIGKYVSMFQSQPRAGFVPGYLCVGEKAPRRHFQSIFQKNGNALRDITDVDFTKMEEVIKAYREEPKNATNGHKGYSGYEDAKKKGVIPVYYQMGEGARGRLYLSFAALGRKAFTRTMNDVSKEKSHQKCDSRKNLCPACSLFGTVEGEGLGSRVRFTDALCVDTKDSLVQRDICFPPLGEPKMSYLPFYMGEIPLREPHYIEGYDSDGLQIRGRKYYWHHMPDMTSWGTVPKKELNASFDAMKEGAEFSFRVYFDGITEDQRRQLAAVLTLNENRQDGNLCHKIGHGKPLGFGSIKITVSGAVLRKFDSVNGSYSFIHETASEIPLVETWSCKTNTLSAFMKISDFHFCDGKGKVEYPSVFPSEEDRGKADQFNENALASHQWFSHNFSLRAQSEQRPNAVLPAITARDLTLKKYQVGLEEQGYGNQGGYNQGRPNNRGGNYQGRPNNRGGNYQGRPGNRGGRY